VANLRTARRSGLVLRGGRNIRETAWVGIVGTNSNLISANTALLFVGLDATLLAMRPFTVIRTRGFWHISSDQEIADEEQSVAMGLAVVSEQATAIGVTAVPTPFTDAGSDLWFMYELLATRFLLGTAVGFSGDFGLGSTFDSKAMRKVEDGQDLAYVIESGPQSQGVNVQKMGRFLIKLH